MSLHNLLKWLKQHRKKVGIWSGGIFVACILFATLLLPVIIKSQAEKGILLATGRVASIEKVRFNPFGMTAFLQGFKLFEPDAKTPFVQLGSLRVSLSSSSLFRFAPVVDELSLDKLQVGLVRTAANRYNFSDILDRLAAQPKKEKSGTPRFSINNISIQGSSIDFEDRAVSGNKKHTVCDLQLAIPFISTIPYLAEQYTDPKFSAVINGAKFSFNGKSKPLAKSMETDLNIKLTDLDLPHYLAYLPAQIPVKLQSGKLSLDLAVAYRIFQNKKPELTVKGLTRLDEISIKEKNNASLASFKRFDVVSKEIELFSRKVLLQQVALDGLAVQIERDNTGRLNFQRLLPAQPAPAKSVAKTAKKETGPPLQLMVENLALTGGTISFLDKQPAGGFKSQLQTITVKLSNLSTAANAQSSYEISFDGDSAEKFAASGTAALSPISATSQFSLSGIKLQRGWPYLQGLLTAPVKGNLSLEGKAAFTTENGASVQDLAVHLKDITAEYGDKDSTRLASLDLTGISFNQKENKAAVDEIKLAGGKIKLSRESDGKLSALSLLKQPASSNAKPVKPEPKVVKAAAKVDQKPLAWQVKKINVTGLSTSFADKQFSEPPVFTLSNIRLSTGNLTGPTFSAMPLQFSSIFGKNAPIKVSGAVTPLPFKFNGTTSFAKLPIQDFESYIPENVNVFVLGGTLDSSMKVNVALNKNNKPTGSFSGSAGVRGFHAVDTVQEEDLLKWESLQLDQINGNIAPFSLGIRQIALNGVYSRIAVRKDGTLNLQNLVTKEQQQKPQPVTATATQAAVTSVPTTTAPPQPSQKAQIKIDTLTVQDGTIAFSDAHLPQQFRSTFHNLGGRVSGLSSDMNTRAEVDLRGNLESHSPLQITGTVNPLRDDLFVDLTISFKDIELSPATPYSGTYLGYEIDKGKLFLDLKYHIENKQLQASNKVFVDQFTFGKSVDSAKATKLPVRLGIALLKDRNGQINLDLPVSGRTDDPKFSIWGVVWQVVANLFIKAATSPFALLSSMMGSSEDLSSVTFAPGSATLTPAEEKKLETLASALSQRPGLKVELSGFIDKQRDPEGYRSELLLQKMRQEKYFELAKSRQTKEGDDAEKMVIQPAEYSRYLKAVYLKEKFPKPRNLIGMIKDLPDAEMKKLIIANTTVGDQELQQLAARRAAAVRQHLINKGKLESQRIFQKQDNILKPPKQETAPASRVELNPIAS
jgi:outer membrane protein OmpA-like peptidoglycan-associated protein